MTTTTIPINRPWVHGELKITRMDESKVRVQAFGLTVNTVPINIEAVLVRGRLDVWSAESFVVQRAAPGGNNFNHGHGGNFVGDGAWKTSRRNQARAREVVLDAVREWAGAVAHVNHRQWPEPFAMRSKTQLPIVADESDDGLLAYLLA